MARIRSHFKNKYVKILTCFFAIALILFTSFSNLFIPIFAADDPSYGGGSVIDDVRGTWFFTNGFTASKGLGIFNIDGELIHTTNSNLNKTFVRIGIGYWINTPESNSVTIWTSNGGTYTLSSSYYLIISGGSDIENVTFITWLKANGIKQITGPDYGDLVIGQTRVFKQNPAPVANMLVSDKFSFTDAYGNIYNEFIAANMLTDGNPLLYIKYGDVYAYGSIDQSLVLLRTWNQLYYRQITFNELPDDQATINFILANSTPVSEPDVPLDPDDPYNSGYNVGYDVGYQAGLQQGYDNGYNAGFADGDYQNGYQAGYEKGTSNTFVKSLFVNFFTGIVEAIDSIVLFEEDGITFTMWDIMVALLVISIIITILVVYRGG